MLLILITVAVTIVTLSGLIVAGSRASDAWVARRRIQRRLTAHRGPDNVWRV